MTLRSLLAAGLLAAPALVSAQSARPLPTGIEALPADALAPRTTRFVAGAPGAAAPRGALATCATGQTIPEVPPTFAAGVTPTGQQLGQSFTAPCDGVFSSVRLVYQATAAQLNATVNTTLLVYAGAGTGGTLLASVPASFTRAATGAFAFTYAIPNVPVVTGGVYTFFVKVTQGAFSIQGAEGTAAAPDPYAGGVLYFIVDGNVATAQPDPTSDLRFIATFGPTPNPPQTVQSPQVFNPTAAQGDGAGWRLLGAPVAGVTITTLANQNLVQGHAAGVNPTVNPAQYPTAGTNVFVAYDQTGFYNASATDFSLAQGRGFFWYLYDRAITPPPTTSGGGTSTSRELSGFRVTATGSASTANVTAQYFFPSTGGDYMLGNPFALPFQLSGLTKTAGDGTLGTVFSVFDPSVGVSGSYVTLAPAAYVAPWQGFFANVATSTTTPTFTYAFASTSTTATPTFYGRSAGAEGALAFRLDGTTAAGVVGDRATTVRFVEDALVGLDHHDGSKLLPPGDTYALLAPIAQDGTEARRLSVNSLPTDLDAATVPLAFMTTSAGTFTLTWDNTLGDARSASLRDLATGELVDLATATEYTFTADAGDWAERFELVLGTRGTTATEATPQAATLSAPTPNPAGTRSTLTLRVDAAQNVRATLVDALGREVAVVFAGSVAPGTDVLLTLDAARLAPGAYVVRVQGETFAESRRVTVAR